MTKSEKIKELEEALIEASTIGCIQIFQNYAKKRRLAMRRINTEH